VDCWLIIIILYIGFTEGRAAKARLGDKSIGNIAGGIVARRRLHTFVKGLEGYARRSLAGYWGILGVDLGYCERLQVG